MSRLLGAHSFVAICIAVLLEELGIPMPVPTDLLIVVAGATGSHSWADFAQWFVVLSLASAIGSSGLYLIVRRGGRPLVERFGRYVHMGPKQLAKGEALLQRGGWSSIALGRAIPGLRYLTVITCGLLGIPFGRFITAHIVGSSVYIGVLLWLGTRYGPAIMESIHLPAESLRLLWQVGLALGLPLLMAWFATRAHVRTRASEPRRALGAVMLASFAGVTAMWATWTAAATFESMRGRGAERPLDLTYALAGWLLGRGINFTTAYMVIVIVQVALATAVGVAYYHLLLPRLARRVPPLPRQILGLMLLCGGLTASTLAPALAARRIEPLIDWWRAGGISLLLVILLGIANYAVTTAYAHALALALLPRTAWNDQPKPAGPTRGSTGELAGEAGGNS